MTCTVIVTYDRQTRRGVACGEPACWYKDVQGKREYFCQRHGLMKTKLLKEK